MGWEREAEACCAIIKKVESVPGEKGGTGKRLLEIKAGFLEEEILERKVGILFLSSQARPSRSLSDSQTYPMVVFLKHLPWLPITPRIKHKFIHFA